MADQATHLVNQETKSEMEQGRVPQSQQPKPLPRPPLLKFLLMATPGTKPLHMDL